MRTYVDAMGSTIHEFFHGVDSIDWEKDLPYDPAVEEIYVTSRKTKKRKDKKVEIITGYVAVNMSFDIETTRVGNLAAPYIYTFCLSLPYSNEFWVFHFRRPEVIELVFLPAVWHKYNLGWNEYITVNRKMICFCHNLSYEYYFVRKYFRWNKRKGAFFAKDPNHCNYSEHIRGIEFRDTMLLTGGSLEQLSNLYTMHKKVKDLDYSIPRHTHTPLTDTELRYIVDDVVILCEFEDFFFDEFSIPGYKLPVTNTNRLEYKVRKAATAANYNTKEVEKMQPDLETMLIDQQWLIRGGLVGSNVGYRGSVKEVYMRDITSSYASAMLTEYFPMSAFKQVELSRSSWYYGDEPDDLKELLATKCVKLHMVYFDIKAKTEHTYELRKKCLQFEPYDWDVDKGLSDGRVYQGASVEVLQTELDYECYKLFYEYKLSTVLCIEVADRGPLPKYFRECIASDYAEKAKLKHAGKKGTPDYHLRKLDVETYFGMTCKGVYISSVDYKNDKWYRVKSNKTKLEISLHNRIFNYYWGVWTSAHGRLKLARMLFKVLKLGGVVMYYDTDSLKYCPSKDGKTEELFESENRAIREKTRTTELLDNDIFYGEYGLGLGEWESELNHPYTKQPMLVPFKTIGTKRYLYYNKYEWRWEWNIKDGWFKKPCGWHLCVAGLSKLASEHLPEDPFTAFDVYGYNFEAEELRRLVSDYHPDPYDVIITDSYGTTETIHCESGITLRPAKKYIDDGDAITIVMNEANDKMERRGFI